MHDFKPSEHKRYFEPLQKTPGIKKSIIKKNIDNYLFFLRIVDVITSTWIFSSKQCVTVVIHPFFASFFLSFFLFFSFDTLAGYISPSPSPRFLFSILFRL